MNHDLQHKLWTILFCTATLVALIAADCLRTIGLEGPRVSAFCVLGSAILGSTLYLETILEKRRRRKLARQLGEQAAVRIDSSQDDPTSHRGGERD